MPELLSNKELAQRYYDIAQYHASAFKYTTPAQQRDLIAEFAKTPDFAEFYARHKFVPHVKGMDEKTHVLLTLIFEQGADKAKRLYASKLTLASDIENHSPRTAWAIEHPPDDEEGSPFWHNIIRALEDTV